MFTYIEESHSVWLNSSSLESEKEFELVGILLGLAIYNGIILDLHFPPVIYKKLQNEKLDLQDLLGVQPSLANSLMQLLEFDGDVEDTFCYTFQVMWNNGDETVSLLIKYFNNCNLMSSKNIYILFISKILRASSGNRSSRPKVTWTEVMLTEFLSYVARNFILFKCIEE